MLNLKYIPKVLETISGLKVNLSKSNTVGIGVDELEFITYAKMFGCKVDTWPLKYLGLPIGGAPRSLSFWDPIGEMVQSKVAYWKKNLIFGRESRFNKGGDVQ